MKNFSSLLELFLTSALFIGVAIQIRQYTLGCGAVREAANMILASLELTVCLIYLKLWWNEDD